MNELAHEVAQLYFVGEISDLKNYKAAQRFLSYVQGGTYWMEDDFVEATAALFDNTEEKSFWVWGARRLAYEDPERYRHWMVLERMGIR